MAQRSIKEISFREPLQPHPEDQRPLERIGFERSEWDQLNWYVQFVGKELDRLTAGEFLSFKEEVRAIERTLVRRMVGSESLSEPSDDEVRQHHSFFRVRLVALADMGMISFTLPETIVNISWHRWSEYLAGRRWLEYHFVQLLKKFHDAIQRCPNPACHKIFLKARSNASFCSRQCQNRMAMKTIRKRSKQKPLKGRRKPQATKTTAERFDEFIRKEDRRRHGN